jgi:uncharacterized protein (TIGR02466 family)
MLAIEKGIIFDSKERLDFINDLVKKFGKNSLILFSDVKNGYGKMIQSKLLEWNPNTFYIDGEVDSKERDKFKDILESQDDVILVASFGTFATGIDSKNLHHIILADKMLSVAKKYLNDSTYIGYRWGYKNTFDAPIKLSEQIDIKPFKDQIEKSGRLYLRQLGYDESTITFETQVFVSEMIGGDYHESHTHPNSILSGLLYLQVPEGSAPLILSDPRPFRQFTMLPTLGNTTTNIEEISITPKKGLLLIWESWIPHVVPKTNNKDGRITMVFNICRKTI